MRQLDQQLLEHFIEHFYGYGDYRRSGGFWFVGIEEGLCGQNEKQQFEEVRLRLNAWHEIHKRDKPSDTIDISIKNHERWFHPPLPLQPTWRGLIRIYLSATQQDFLIKTPKEQRDIMRAYQVAQLARPCAETCLLELFPLPCHSHCWYYDKWSNISTLRSKESYCDDLINQRAEHIGKMVKISKPATVVMYSWKSQFMRYWKVIAGIDDGEFQECRAENIRFHSHNSTVFVVIRHPADYGVSNNYLDGIGTFISSRLMRQTFSHV